MAGLAYEGSSSSRMYSDWAANLHDPNDAWWQDAATLSSRSWWLYDNDPHFRALVDCLVNGVLGADGLSFRSLYQEDDDPDTSDAESKQRGKINASVRRATHGTQLDAACNLTYRELSECALRSAYVTGDGFGVRTWKPGRPNAYQGNAWRLIDSSRVSNPNFTANTKNLFEGIVLDDFGTPTDIWVQRSHPRIFRIAPVLIWDKIPIYDPVDGSRIVIHRKRVSKPDQLRGTGLAAPVIMYLRMLGQSAEAWVIAKRMQASYGLLVKCEDPKAAAKSDRNGAVLNGTVGIKPGMRYYHNFESVEPLNFQFQGTDFENFRNPIIEAVSASVQVPYEIVLQRLTKSALASSRAALLTFYNTCSREQNQHIQGWEAPIVENMIREDQYRGRLDLNTEDWPRALRGKWLRPPRVWPDPLKEAQAVEAWADMGDSLTDLYAEAGKDFESRVMQRAQDDEFLKIHGVELKALTISATKPASIKPGEVDPNETPPAATGEQEPEKADGKKPGDVGEELPPADTDA